MMLENYAEKYYLQGFNCAESIIKGANDLYELKLSDHDMKMTAAFGAGLQIGDLCGALSASACVLSCLYVKTKAHESDEIGPVTRKMVVAFQKEMGSRLCAKIKPVHFDKEVRCLNTVKLSCKILEEVIADFNQELASK